MNLLLTIDKERIHRIARTHEVGSTNPDTLYRPDAYRLRYAPPFEWIVCPVM
jgi:hypothetical protein